MVKRWLMSLRFAVFCALCLLASACKRSSSAHAPAASGSSGSPHATVAATRIARCTEPTPDSVFTLGEEKPDATDKKEEGATEDAILPFATEVGDGVAWRNGFALGALTPQGRGTAAVVFTVAIDGKNRKVISLGQTHGDTPPPRLASQGDTLVVALLESAAAGRRLRLGRIALDGSVLWGPAFEQGRDESLGYDVALGEPDGLVVWDDEEASPDRGVIRIARFQTATLGSPSLARTVTPKQTDAEMPRIIRRPGGFWLFWIARRPDPQGDQKEQAVGEDVEFRWLEAMPLDETGAPTAPARRLTPTNGHVLTYDAVLGAGGSTVVVVYREDDGPSGAAAGTLLRVVVRPDGASAPAVLADKDIGGGAPMLLPGWLAVADATEKIRLASLGANGELTDALLGEPVFGAGEPVAASGEHLLIARPRGRAVQLFVTRCTHESGSNGAAGSGAQSVPVASASAPGGR